MEKSVLSIPFIPFVYLFQLFRETSNAGIRISILLIWFHPAEAV
jgi:hypothetical protein